MKVNEIFYSIQGEGYWVGTPMIFLRLSGCNLKCKFCDTQHQSFVEKSEWQIIKALGRESTCKRVCITGGEPFLQDITNLLIALREEDYTIHIETNGTISPPCKDLLYKSCWVTVSPKLHPLELNWADEVKYLVGDEMKFWEAAISSSPLYAREFLQPIWGDNYEKNLQLAVKTVKENPRFRLSLQTQKMIGVR